MGPECTTHEVADSVTAADSVLVTARLTLRRLQLADAAFIVALLNDPAFLRHIGDKGVRTVEDAHEYLRKGPMASYATHGFGLYLVATRFDGRAIGICGLIKRESLADVDLGFAMLPLFRGQGYTFEASSAVLGFARTGLGLSRVVAVVAPDNQDSIRVLEKLGMRFDSAIRLSSDSELLKLYCSSFTGEPT